MVTLYRSGGITPLSLIPNRASLLFDRMAKISGATEMDSYAARSESVYASPFLDAAYRWSGWRKQQELDAEMWSLTVSSENLFSYNIHHYDAFAVAYRDFERSKDTARCYNLMLESVLEYYATAKPLGAESSGGNTYLEVLVPWSVASEAVWVDAFAQQECLAA